MAIIINNIKLPLANSSHEAAIDAAKAILNAPVKSININKVSLDARNNNNIMFVYSVLAELNLDEEKFASELAHKDVKYLNTQPPPFVVGKNKSEVSPVVVGFGPCGMFAALVLARHGFNPIVLERGGDIQSRVKAVNAFWNKGILNEKNNVQFGEGGAGTFSDGKLTTRVKDKYLYFVLGELVRHGAPPEILYTAKPHIGTDKLRRIVVSIREEIIQLGGKVLFNTELEDIITEKGVLKKIKYAGEYHNVSSVILAPGNSSVSTFELMHERGVDIASKPFSVGVRIEHLQEDINRGLYGDMAGLPALPIGEYQLSHRVGGKAVYTFCMCPGGIVIPSASESSTVVVNGMSVYARDSANANSALVVSVDESDYGKEWDGGIKYRTALEKAAFNPKHPYKAPMQSVDMFMQNKSGLNIDRVIPSAVFGGYQGDFLALFPKNIHSMLKTGLEVFGRKLPGFSAPYAIMTGVETRTSSPVRIPRDESLQSVNTQGLYPAGEGAGYAGGIMSAALDGIRIAAKIMEK